MSFILDALKKSEAERRQGEVPKLQNAPFSPPPRRRPVWPLVLALALLLNGVVLGWWLLSADDGPATDEIAAVSIRQNDAGGRTAVTDPARRLPVSKVEPPVADGSTLSAVQPPAEPQPLATLLPAEPEVVIEVIDEPGIRTATSDISAKPAKIVEKEPTVRPAAHAPAPAPATAKVNRPKVVAPAQVAEAYPPISDLPSNVRSSLPRLDLQLHFFTPDPERRLVRLNGINLRQGGSSGDGLSVVEITSDGVRLAYGGNRFFLPTGRP